MSPSDSDEKAQQILKAAAKILAQNGYAGTTINLVATEAGVSRGLLHYYFKNKEEMLVKVIQINLEISVALIKEIFLQSYSADSIASGITKGLRQVMENDPDFFRLFFEGFAVARQSQLVNERLKLLYNQFRDNILNGLQEAEKRKIISPRFPMEGLAALITGIIDGIGLQLLTEPELIKNDEIWDCAYQGVALLLSHRS